MGNTIKGMTVEISADTKKFNKEIKSMDKGIGETKKQVDSLSNSLKIEWDSGRFAQAQKLAQQAIDQTQEKVVALRNQLKYLDDSGVDPDTDAYRKLQTELTKTETNAVMLKAKLQEIKELRFDELAAKIQKIGGSFTSLGNALTPVSAAAGAMLAAFAAIGTSTVKNADELATLSEQINISAVALQKWQYIAMQTDVTDSELQTGLAKIQSALADLAGGTVSTATAALEALDISSEQAALGMSANFETIIQRLSGVTDATTQAALANEIFGDKLGSKIIPLLNEGGSGLAALTAEFETFDYLTNEEVNSLGDFDNAMNKIKYSFETIKDQIGVALLPLMEKLSGFIQGSVIPSVQKLADWFGQLSIGQQETIAKTLLVVAALAPALLMIGKLTSGIGSMVKMAGGLSNAFGVLSAHPIIAVIGVLVGLFALLYSKNEEFKTSIDGLISSLGDAFMPVMTSVGEIFTTLITSIMPIIEILSSMLVPVIVSLIPVVLELVNAIMPLVNTLVGSLAPILSAIFPAIVSILNAIIPLVNIILSAVLPVLLDVMNFITPIIDLIVKSLVPVIQWLGKAWSDVFNAIPGIMEKVLQGVEDFINGAIGLINNLIKGLNKIGEVLGFTVNEIAEVEFSGALKTEQTTVSTVAAAPNVSVPAPSQSATSAAQVAVSVPTVPSTTVNNSNDYSTKSVNVDKVIINNYEGKLTEEDAREFLRKLNLGLAGEF